MTFAEAKNFIMPWGQHAGRTLDQIAVSDLGYLDWLRGEREGERQPIDKALDAYLDDPSIQKELEDA